jgi:serine/threonine-protein kinase
MTSPTLIDDRPPGMAGWLDAAVPDPVGPDGRYEPLRPLDEGAQATTWYGVDRETDREVAIKLVPVEVSRASGRLDWMRKVLLRRTVPLQDGPQGGPEYPHIGEILTTGVTDGVYYQISPYYSGGSLGALLASPTGGSIRVDRMLQMIEDVLQGLQSAGEWFHGDIKPDNLVFDGPRLRVIDWGVSKLRSRLGDGQTSMPPGSFAYMSPEQTRAWFLRSEILGGRSKPRLALMDLYSVGSVAMHIATGEPAYALEKITYEGQGWWEGTLPPPRIDRSVPGTPPPVVSLIMTWVDLDPARRGGGPSDDVIGAALDQLRRTRAALTPAEGSFLVGRDQVVAAYPQVTTQPMTRPRRAS